MGEKPMLDVEGELGVETLWIQVGIAGHRGALPQICKLTASCRKPIVGDRIVSDVSLVQRNRFAVEKVGKGLIGSGGITLSSGSDRYSADEVLIKGAFQAKAYANSSSVSVLSSILYERFTADADVAVESKPADRGRQSRDLLLVFLAHRRFGLLLPLRLSAPAARIRSFKGTS